MPVMCAKHGKGLTRPSRSLMSVNSCRAVGLLPTGIAPAMWWSPDAVQWPFRVLPRCWTVDVLWHPTSLSPLAGAAVVAALLLRRILRRFDTH